jgi:hypothetical protein
MIKKILKKLEIIIIFLLSYISIYSQTNCKGFDANDFVFNGKASVTGSNEVTLTPDSNNVYGTLWSQQKVLFSQDFTIDADLFLGSTDGRGADGIAFVIQPLSSNAGEAGGGMGYQGISPSFAIEFDTWFNSGMDPITNDHVALMKNGDVVNHSTIAPYIDLGNIEDGKWHRTLIEWKAAAKTLKLTFDGVVLYNLSVDLKSIFLNNDSVFWGFTAATGAAKNLQKVKIYNYCVTYASSKAPTGNGTQVFCASPAPTLANLSAVGNNIKWYATCNGISCYDISEKKWKSYCTEKELPQYENHIFLSVCEIRPGIILAGGYMSGIFRIDKKAGTTTFHQQGKSQARETPDKYIRGLIKDKNEVIWSGGFYSLKSFDTRTQEKQEYSSSYPITYLLERNENSFWVGTIQGLYVFDKTKRQLYPYMEKEDFGCINAIYNTPDLKKTYVGTYGNGLFIIDNQTNEITHCMANNSGLQTNNIYSIVPDKNGNLFLGTENGLSFYNRKEQTFTNWTREQGLQGANFNPTAGIHTRNGQLIFGSNEGVIILPDSLELPSSFSSHMVFSNLNIMYHPVHPMEKNSPLTKILDETNFIQLKYDQNTFSMDVSSINFDNPSSILYSWKLEGFYDQWTPPTSNGTIL